MKVNCDYCGKETTMTTRHQKTYKHHFCSRECYGKHSRNSIKANCDYCGKEIEITAWQQKICKHYFCNRKCCGKYQRTLFIKFNCEQCGKEKEIPRIYYEQNQQHHFCSVECRGKYQIGKQLTEKTKAKMSAGRTGKNNPNWKGNKAKRKTKKIRMRGTRKYQEWRKAVFERDNYICQRCGCRSGNGKAVYLEVHHIKSFKKYPRKRYDIENGITLCVSCHHNFIHTKKAKVLKSNEIGQEVLQI